MFFLSSSISLCCRQEKDIYLFIYSFVYVVEERAKRESQKGNCGILIKQIIFELKRNLKRILRKLSKFQ